MMRTSIRTLKHITPFASAVGFLNSRLREEGTSFRRPVDIARRCSPVLRLERGTSYHVTMLCVATRAVPAPALDKGAAPNIIRTRDVKQRCRPIVGRTSRPRIQCSAMPLNQPARKFGRKHEQIYSDLFKYISMATTCVQVCDEGGGLRSDIYRGPTTHEKKMVLWTWDDEVNLLKL
jgi:hypothetical protein